MGKDRINQILTIVIWMVGIVLWIIKGWWYIVAAVAALHLAEIFIVGVRTGKEAGKSPAASAVMTFMFGFTWWLPLKKRLR